MKKLSVITYLLLISTFCFAQSNSRPTKKDALDFLRGRFLTYSYHGGIKNIEIDETSCRMNFSGGGLTTINFSELDGNSISWSTHPNEKTGIEVLQLNLPSKNGVIHLYFDAKATENDPKFKERIEKALTTAIIYCGGDYKEEKF